MSQFKAIFNKLSNCKSYKKIISEINNEPLINNVEGSFKSLLLIHLAKSLNQKILFISNNQDQLKDIYHDLKLIDNDLDVNLLIEPKSTLRSKISNSNSLDWIVEGLINFKQSQLSLLLCEENILNFELPETNYLIGQKMLILKNENRDFEKFTKDLILNGFERTDYISSQGQIAIRGGIVDIYPLAKTNPIRIEFWGNEIDSIREFEIISQRSIREYDKIEFINSMFSDNESKNSSSIYEYVGSEVIIFHDESIDSKKLKEGFINSNVIGYDWSDKRAVSFNTVKQPSYNGSVRMLIKDIEKYLIESFDIYIGTESSIHQERFKNLIDKTIEELNNSDLDNQISVLNLNKFINWSNGSFSKGFVNNELKIVYITEHELFQRLRVNDSPKNKKNKSMTLKELQDLKIGDYVVHEDKGIGVFDGFQTISINDSKQDCARVRFADGDMLYVHLNYISKLSKYSAQDGAAPILSKLGSSDWFRRKERTKKRLKDIARDLIKLYAERKSQKGFAFPTDTTWQNEFEASFTFEDTPDQSSATIDIKNDMESPTPMDRLVCGDVGFGKTEVAIRAAFKAAQAGKQTAVLVPTTILAQQHFMSFKDRLSNYPVNVDVISRFRTKSEQTKIIDKTKSGEIDILIGTHRLLSKDIELKNLGLLIVDEEHRFGVSHKEKLRQLKANVDTLTLTATPIPRTLNFSLMGARDLSLIETPPRNRIPVITEIVEWENETVVQAIDTEISRGGQVFFVSDKIEDIEKIADDVRKLMPHLKVVVAHGQMNPSTLEDIMEKFIEGKYDVLVATKIIESGIDIPNANTILINRAQNFGLAELYQLRGRVGRSNIQAYCYLIIPPAHKLNQKSLQRLQAIEEFTELGSGFKLSMRDLEIRGAGNLLGAEQSGFITDIGFELYQKVLEEAVNELKINEFADIFSKDNKEKDVSDKYANVDLAIEIDEDALFPSEYISSDTDRFMYYKKLYSISNNYELEEIRKEIKDKYGKMPKESVNLFFAVQLRIAGLNTGFSRINIKNNKMTCEFPPKDFKDYYDFTFPQIVDYLSQFDNYSLKQNREKLFLEFVLENKNQSIEIIWKIKRIVEMSIES